MDWDMEVEDLKEFEKAFNSYLHHGYLKKKYYHYKIYIDKILGQDSYYSEAARRESVKNKKKESKKNKYNALDLIHNLSLDIDELGSEKVIKIQRNVLCKNCEFFSEKNYVKIGCNSCKKTGIDENYEKCKECLGKGFHRKYECKTCENKKYVKKSFDELIMIPLGANNGEKIVFKGRGHQHVKNGNFGDLVIVVCLTSKTGFSSKNPNLKISIADAVLGLNKKVNTIKGIKKVCIPPGVQDGEVLQLENIFYDPHKSEEYIKIELKIPQQISEAEKQVYQKLKKIQILKKERLKDDSWVKFCQKISQQIITYISIAWFYGYGLDKELSCSQAIIFFFIEELAPHAFALKVQETK